MLSWQQHNRFHFVSLAMSISGANFKEDYWNISRYILYSVFYHFKGLKLLKELWYCVGGGNKVIWLYQLS